MVHAPVLSAVVTVARSTIAYQEHGSSNVRLTFGSKDDNEVAGGFLERKADRGIGLLLDIMDKDALLSQKISVVSPRNGDRLESVVFVLIVASASHLSCPTCSAKHGLAYLRTDHVNDSLLHDLEIELVLCRCSSDHVVFVFVITTDSCKLLTV